MVGELWCATEIPMSAVPEMSHRSIVGRPA
jgi:hypothetical protein